MNFFSAVHTCTIVKLIILNMVQYVIEVITPSHAYGNTRAFICLVLLRHVFSSGNEMLLFILIECITEPLHVAPRSGQTVLVISLGLEYILEHD